MTARTVLPKGFGVGAIIDGRTCYANDGHDLSALLDTVFHWLPAGWAARLFVFTETHPMRVGDDRLRLATDPDTAWAALNFLHYDHTDRCWHTWNTLNPTPEPHTPRLRFGSSGLFFPTDAALPLPHARQAVAEYCHTATQPTCVRWQPTNYL
jgi:hypothetical protein